jgi:soluble lytic murein transglycosylase-like protein
MQLIPATAKRFGVRDSYNADQNIRGGVKYLKFLKARFRGDLKKVIAAYNAGEGAVDKYKGIPPYKETKNYVKNVLKVYAKLSPKKSRLKKTGRVRAVYQPPKLGNKAGRHGWQYNRRLAPHLYKK